MLRVRLRDRIAHLAEVDVIVTSHPARILIQLGLLTLQCVSLLLAAANILRIGVDPVGYSFPLGCHHLRHFYVRVFREFVVLIHLVSQR